MARSLLLALLALAAAAGSAHGQSSSGSESADVGGSVGSASSGSDDYCGEESVAYYLSLPQVTTCGEESGYNFSSGVAPTYQDAVNICGTADCTDFFVLVRNSVSDCRIPFGTHFRWRTDLIEYVLDVCAELGSTSASDSSGSATLGPIAAPGDSTASASGDSGGSSAVPIAVAVAVAAGVLVLLGLLWFFWRRHKQAQENSPADELDQRGSHELYVAMLSNVDAGNEGAGRDGHSMHTGTTGTTASSDTVSSVLSLSSHSRRKRPLRLSDLNHWRVDVDSIQDLERIGHGAHGVVWRVLYRNTTVLASKRIQTDQITSKRTQDFIEEILLVSQLQHPNIVEFIGVAWTMEADLQVLLEFMNKGDLRSHLLEPETPRTWTLEKLSIALDIAQALVFVHSFRPPLVHRDLKSHNVMLTTTTSQTSEEGKENNESDRLTAKLTDFGVSRFHSENNTMTIGVGTSRWLAPEVILGKSNYGPEADIYSFGVVLSELDTHELPYDDARTGAGDPLPNVAILQRVAMGLLKPTFRTETCIPAVFELAQRCLSHNGLERPTAPQVAYELRNIIKAMKTVIESNEEFAAE